MIGVVRNFNWELFSETNHHEMILPAKEAKRMKLLKHVDNMFVGRRYFFPNERCSLNCTQRRYTRSVYFSLQNLKCHQKITGAHI